MRKSMIRSHSRGLWRAAVLLAVLALSAATGATAQEVPFAAYQQQDGAVLHDLVLAHD